MRILLVTQEENIYLPQSFGTVCRELGTEIIAIVSAPAMSTHGGKWTGLKKHLALFRFRGTFHFGMRILYARLMNIIAKPSQTGPWYSIRHVANSFRIPYIRINKLSSPEFDQLLNELKPELLISMSCPQIIRKNVRDRFPAGCINVHGAPLPKYRGLMPAFWMLLNQESEGAATVHVLSEKLDDGEILKQVRVPIYATDTWDSLVRKTKSAGAGALIETVRDIAAGTVQYQPNREDEATYFSFPSSADAKKFYQQKRRFF